MLMDICRTAVNRCLHPDKVCTDRSSLNSRKQITSSWSNCETSRFVCVCVRVPASQIITLHSSVCVCVCVCPLSIVQQQRKFLPLACVAVNCHDADANYDFQTLPSFVSLHLLFACCPFCYLFQLTNEYTRHFTFRMQTYMRSLATPHFSTTLPRYTEMGYSSPLSISCCKVL